MPAEFDQGFFVRKPAWHKLGVVLDYYPGREEAMVLAGHDWEIVESPLYDELDGAYYTVPGWKQHRRSDDGRRLYVSRDSFASIPNRVGYDFAEALLDQGFLYETGISLREGALCALTLKLDEPIQIPGDNSPILPYLGLSWAHDGSGALKGRSTTVRQVCANTVAASEAEGSRLGTDFTVRHTKNWRDYVKQAQEAIKGTRENYERYEEIATIMASVGITTEQRATFVREFIFPTAREHLLSDRVAKNVDEARGAVAALFNGPTIPEAHRFTAYGLHLAGVEYADHVRGWRKTDTYAGRQLLRDEPMKKKIVGLIEKITETNVRAKVAA